MAAGRPFAVGHDARREHAPPPPPNRKKDRPDDLIKYVRKVTKQGRALADWLLSIADGTATTTREVATKDGGTVELTDRPTHRERLVAIRELWDRGMGTPVQPDKLPEASAAEDQADDELVAAVRLLAEPPPPPEPARGGGDAGDPGDGNGGAA